MSETSSPEEQRYEEIKSLLRERGLRYSRARELILDVFRCGGGHVGAEGIHQRLRDRGEDVSLSTVYLNLSVLKEAGLIHEFRGAGGEALFDHNTEPHYHLICKESGKVVDVPAIEVDGVPLGRFLKERIEQETGWVVDEPRFELLGRSPVDETSRPDGPAEAQPADAGDEG